MTEAPSSTGALAPRPFWLEALLAFLGFLAVSGWYLRPIWQHFATAIAPDLGDPLFNVVVLDWGMRSIRNGLTDFWNLPIFFPVQGATAFSDHLFGLAALTTLLSPVLPNTTAAYNFLFLTSFVGCGTSAWWVFRRAGLGAFPAFLGGGIFAFSAFRWDQLSHLQVLWMLWIPPVLWTFHRLLAAPCLRSAVVFAVFYALHVTGGCYLAYMIHVPLLVLFCYHAPSLWRLRSRRSLTILAATAVVCLATIAAVSWPYIARSEEQRRRKTEILEFGASAASYFSASAHNQFGAWSGAWRRPENTLFTGILPTAVLLAALPGVWRRRRTVLPRPLSPEQRAVVIALGTIAVTCLVFGEGRTWAWALRHKLVELPHFGSYKLGVVVLLSGGTALLLARRWGGGWPFTLRDLPIFERALALSSLFCALLTFPTIYLALMRYVPGLEAMRVPTRFFAFVSLGVAYFVAREIVRWQARIGTPTVRRWATAGFSTLLFLDLSPTALAWQPVARHQDLPAVYQWLAQAPNVTAVFELPIGDYVDYIPYMYAGTLHKKPLVGGYSGFLAPHFEALRDCCRPTPRPQDLERLRSWGVSHVVLHVKRPAPLKRMWEWSKQEGILFEFEKGSDFVFRILPAPGPATVSSLSTTHP